MNLITQEGELAPLLLLIEQSETVGLDTEFERRTTFFPKPALLQIQVNNETFLIDPTSCKGLDKLFLSLASTNILMHACREDLEVFRIMSDLRISSFFDTQIAASLVGFDSQISYQNLVFELLSVELSKSETCSDWLQRPLSENQIQYAADDVIYLEKVNNLLLDKLKSLDRIDWYRQEMSFLKSLVDEPSATGYFFKMKGLGRLNRLQLQAAYELLLWRDELAKNKNIPRGFIIKDKGLLQIIKSVGVEDVTKQTLHELDDVPAPFIRRYAENVSEIIQSKNSSTASDEAINIVMQKLPDASKKVKKELKLYRDEKVSLLNIKPEVLFSNRLLEECLDALYFQYQETWSEGDFNDCFEVILNPWRYTVFKEKLFDIAKQI